MHTRGRPVLGALAGLLFGVGVVVQVLVTGVVALDSPAVTVGPVAGLVLGIALGLLAPFGSRGRRDATGEVAP